MRPMAWFIFLCNNKYFSPSLIVFPCVFLCFCPDQCVICSAEGSGPPLWLPVWQTQQRVHALPLGGEGSQKVSRRRPKGQRVCAQLLQVTHIHLSECCHSGVICKTEHCACGQRVNKDVAKLWSQLEGPAFWESMWHPGRKRFAVYRFCICSSVMDMWWENVLWGHKYGCCTVVLPGVCLYGKVISRLDVWFISYSVICPSDEISIELASGGMWDAEWLAI